MNDFNLDSIEQYENDRDGNVLIYIDGLDKYKCVSSGVMYDAWLAKTLAAAGLCELEE